MASHCHLIDQFWTPNANRRSDEYGGPLANRMRFGIEVLRAVAIPRRRCERRTAVRLWCASLPKSFSVQ